MFVHLPLSHRRGCLICSFPLPNHHYYYNGGLGGIWWASHFINRPLLRLEDPVRTTRLSLKRYCSLDRVCLASPKGKGARKTDKKMSKVPKKKFFFFFLELYKWAFLFPSHVLRSPLRFAHAPMGIKKLNLLPYQR